MSTTEAAGTTMYDISCAEIWGGIKDRDLDARTSGVTASLYSSSCTGGRGGDIYYLSVCAGDALTRIAVADVVGHGSAVSAVSQSLYNALAKHMNCIESDQVLADLNRFALAQGMTAMTTAVIMGIVKPALQIRVCYAGHPPVLLRGSDGDWRGIEAPVASDNMGMPLGVMPDATFGEICVDVTPGDRLCLFTDGVSETRNAEHELFGTERLRDTLADCGNACPSEIKSSILAALTEHAGGSLDHDDITLVVCDIAE